jgi:hypothetical protein
MERMARLLDASWRIPGTRFRVGLDPLIGLIPVVGDLAGAAASLWLVHRARRLGARRRTVGRMLVAVLLEATLGAVPLVGDLFDAGFKANQRILAWLREDAPHLADDDRVAG